jgi:glycosyltransferase involved in cell wall biosynthesis
MHVAFWSPAWPLAKAQNGITTYVHWMKRGLESHGHRVSVFTEALHPSGDDPNVYHVRHVRPRIWNRALRRVASPWRSIGHEVFDFSTLISMAILKVHHRDPIDVIEMEESFGWFADVARLTSIPLVVKLHGPAFLSLVENELNSPFGRQKIDREGQALKVATAIIAPSRSTLAQTVERYGLTPREKRHVVNPITMDGDTPLWRLEHCNRKTILFVGRFDLHKGADIILNAFSLILKDRPDLKLVFVGPDRGIPTPDGKRIQFETYRDLIFPAALRQRVDFRGPLSNGEISMLRLEAMVSVVASRWESAGYTILEAMLQGCPLVSTDAGGCPESVINGVTGRLAKSEDPAAFAVQLSAMLDDPIGAAAMGEAARRFVVEHHSVSRVAAAMLELYEDVISNHSG